MYNSHRYSKIFFKVLALLFVFGGSLEAQCTFTVSTSASTICAGRSVTLSANGTSNYTWTPGGNSATIVDSPSSTQQYVVSGSDGVCTTTQSITIMVVPVPTVAASSNSPAICAGLTAVLSETSNISGTDAGLYWLPGMGTSASITVTPLAATVYTVVVYNGGGICSASTTVQQSIYASPNLGFSVSESTLCSGNAFTITPSGAATYTILPGNYTTTTAFDLISAVTNYTVTGQSVNNCTATAIVPVTVAPTPSLVINQAPSFICAGQSTTLFTSGADAYYWLPGSFSSGTIVINPTLTGIYSVQGFNNTGCSGTATTSVFVNSTPTISFANTSFATCSGVPLTLTVTGAGSYTWQPWNNTGSLLTVSPASNTTYTVTGTGTNSCFQTTYAAVAVSQNPVLSISGGSSLCAGSTLTLTGNGASTYTWAPGNVNTSSIIINPSSLQVFTLNGQNGAGCSGSVTATVNVVPLPSLSLTSSNSSVCLGEAVDLMASGAQSYTWMPGNFITNSLTTIPNTSTYYKVSASSSGCFDQDSLQVVVWPVPLLTLTGDTTVCQGSNLVLGVQGANSYSWMPGSLTGPNLSVTPSSSVQYTLTGMNTYGCISERRINTFVDPTPTLNALVSPLSSCGPELRTFNVSGAGTYTWIPGNIQASTFTLSVPASQIYTVTGTLGDCESSTSLAVNVFPVPTISVSTSAVVLCTGEAATLSASGAMTYSWDSGSINDTIIVWPTNLSSYIVTGTSAQGCTSTYTFVQQVNDCTGLPEHDADTAVHIYPNPNTGDFVIDLTNTSSGPVTIYIYDLQGQLVYSNETSLFPASINVRGIKPGAYTVMVSGKQSFVSRLLIAE